MTAPRVVLVIGPPLAGATSLAAALRVRMPDVRFTESPADGAAVVVFAVSAVAPLTGSDCAIVDAAAEHLDAVVGAVTKIDVHRRWRELIADDRAILGRHRPRYADVPWVGVAAAPHAGDPQLGGLVEVLRRRLADPATARRNNVRAREHELAGLIARRAGIRRTHRTAQAQRGIALRAEMQRARVHLSHLARDHCAALRTELQEEVAGLNRRGLRAVEDRVRVRAVRLVADLGEVVAAHLTGVAHGLDLPAAPPVLVDPPAFAGPTVRPRRLETRLMTVLGAGFGLGVALAVSRLFSGLDPGLTVAGLVAGGLVGLAVTVWVVGIRSVLHDRAAIDRWIAEVCAALRSGAEEMVATLVLSAESDLARGLLLEDEKSAVNLFERTAEIDARVRRLAVSEGHFGGEMEFAARKRGVTDQ